MSIILFIVSLFVLFGLVASKVFEIKFRKVHFLSRVFVRGDDKITGVFDKAIYKYNRYKKITKIFIFDFIPSYAYELLVKMKDYVSKRYYMMADDEFRGRRMLRSSGSVSFFLERLSEDKSGAKSHKI